MIENDELETYHIYREPGGGITIRREAPETVDSTPPAYLRISADRHGAIMIIAASILMAFLVALAPNSPITQQITLVHAFSIPRDVQSFTLAPVTKTATRTIATTGIGHTPATYSHGYLVLYNGSFTQQDIPANMIFTTASGTQIVTDSPVMVPAGNPPNYGQATISAHALTAGTSSNIRAYGIDQQCCFSAVKAINETAFSGGRDARSFHTVTKQDIKAPAIQPSYALTPDDTLIHGSCSTKVTANHHPGEEATNVKVTTFETCSGSAYSRTTLQKRARQLVPIPPGFLLQAMAVLVVRTTPTGVFVSIKYTILYDFTKRKGKE